MDLLMTRYPSTTHIKHIIADVLMISMAYRIIIAEVLSVVPPLLHFAALSASSYWCPGQATKAKHNGNRGR
jgi:hypothetical protein